MTSSGSRLSAAALALALLSACAGTVGLRDGCAGPSTPIHQVQGAGDASPLAGERVTVTGVVVGDFQGPDRLGGFFLQAPEPDADPRTSEGLFVAAPRAAVAAGDRVRATGRVAEVDGLTSLTDVEEVAVCGRGEPLAPAALSLRGVRDLEPWEGMAVALADALTVASNHPLGQHGQLMVAAGGRPFAATNGELPPDRGEHRLLLDDGSRLEYPATPPYLDGAPTRRVGDSAADLAGVVAEAGGDHVLHPTSAPRFASLNPRPAAPPAVGGTVRVASLNLLNFFTTFGERGASDARELERQRAKLVAAIAGLDADVVGLMELENNGDAALLDLVDGLNARASAGSAAWAHVPDPGGGGQLGDDVIRVGFIYRPATARPIGAATADLDPVFKRPPLAQTFELGGERLTVVVNHFKSKGCGSAAGVELDAGDGQGCWNALRTRQAERLLAFVARLQAATGDDDVLVIGDLNAYGGEDPIRALRAGGLVDLVAAHVPPAERYTYVYRGVSGYLDHAFATPGLAGRVTGAAIWHVNADEPTLFDYNTEHNPPALYRPDPFRSSDHDPVLVGLGW